MTKINQENRIQMPLETEADELRRQRIEEIRRRLESGELDSDLALVETALALLDGDVPQV